MSGLGNDGGNIEGDNWSPPSGISIDYNSIRGYDESKSLEMFNTSGRGKENYDFSEEENNNGSFKTTYPTYGSGYWVRILVPFTNTTSTTISVELPMATIFQCSTSDYQNGLLMKKVRFDVTANSTYQMVLHLYCCNLSRHGSSNSASYNRIIVCNYPSIRDLCERFKDKKINYEEVPNDYTGLVARIQRILWNLTQFGHNPSHDDYAWIAALPASN
jgi:hypothetical protein